MCVCVCVCVCTRVCVRVCVCVCLLHERINGRHVCQCKVCKFANTHVHVGVLISWCSSCVYERERECVCVCVCVYLFSWHSLHERSRETWMCAGLTDREMGECRRGRMDGGERDEYWLISGKIDSQRIMGTFRLCVSFFLSLTFLAHLFLPSYATTTALEFLKWFIIWYAESWCVYIQESFTGNPFLSLCLIGRARAKYFLIHENYMKPNHI